MSRLTNWLDGVTAMKRPDMDMIVRLLKEESVYEQQIKRGESEGVGEKEITYVQGWIERLKGDETHHVFLLDHVLELKNLQNDKMIFVEKFHDALFINRLLSVVVRHMKGEIPNRDEMNSIRSWREWLDHPEALYDPRIQEFVAKIRHEIFDHLIEMRKRHKGSKKELNELMLAIQKADKLKHLLVYFDEIKWFEEKLYKMMHDDKAWTYFRNEIYAKLEDRLKEIREKFKDPKRADKIAKFFAERHEDRQGAMVKLHEIIQELKSPAAVKEAEREGIEQVKIILEKTDKFMRAQLESLRKELITVCERRIKELKSSKGSKSRSIMKEQNVIGKYIEKVAGLGDKLAGKSDQQAIAELNHMLAEPGKVRHGLQKLRTLVKNERVSLYKAVQFLDRLTDQRVNFNKNAKEAKRNLYRQDEVKAAEAITFVKKFSGTAAEKWTRIDMSHMLSHAIVEYDKELLLIRDESEWVRRMINTIMRYQQAEANELQRHLVKGAKARAKARPVAPPPPQEARVQPQLRA